MPPHLATPSWDCFSSPGVINVDPRTQQGLCRQAWGAHDHFIYAFILSLYGDILMYRFAYAVDVESERTARSPARSPS
jgi:hypothetical protein